MTASYSKTGMRPLAWALTLAAFGLISLPPSAIAEPVEVKLSDAAQRSIEDSTLQALQKQYTLAWQELEIGLQENNPDVFRDAMVGMARDQYTAQIQDQKRENVKIRFIDHGHTVKAIFYSHDGSTVQLQDIAQMEIQLLDGGKVVSSQTRTLNYLSLMTVVDDRWKVRLLEAVPSF